jgi:hypothetical protein
MSDVKPPGALQVQFDCCEECKGLDLGWEMRGDALVACVYFRLPDGRRIAACAQFSYPKWSGGYMTPELRRAAIQVRRKVSSLVEPDEWIARAERAEARVAELEAERNNIREGV